MQLYSWLQEHPNATKLEIDNILDGNICRYQLIYIHLKISFVSILDNNYGLLG